MRLMSSYVSVWMPLPTLPAQAQVAAVAIMAPGTLPEIINLVVPPFFDEEAYAIKSFIARLAKIAATTIKNVAQWLVWVAKEIGQLTDIELHRADGEVNDVVDGKYDWRIGKLENHNGLVR